jgi:hypothetical protein
VLGHFWDTSPRLCSFFVRPAPECPPHISPSARAAPHARPGLGPCRDRAPDDGVRPSARRRRGLRAIVCSSMRLLSRNAVVGLSELLTSFGKMMLMSAETPQVDTLIIG